MSADISDLFDPPGAPPGPAAPRRQPDDSDAALGLIAKYESGDRNVPNYRFDPTHTAQGHYQITNTNWHALGPQAGVDTRRYPSAMTAPKEVQASVARLMYQRRGFDDWAPFNPALKAAIGRGEHRGVNPPSPPTGYPKPPRPVGIARPSADISDLFDAPAPPKPAVFNDTLGEPPEPVDSNPPPEPEVRSADITGTGMGAGMARVNIRPPQPIHSGSITAPPTVPKLDMGVTTEEPGWAVETDPSGSQPRTDQPVNRAGVALAEGQLSPRARARRVRQRQLQQQQPQPPAAPQLAVMPEATAPVAGAPGAPTTPPVDPREATRNAVRAQVAGERAASAGMWIPYQYLQSPLTAIAEGLGSPTLTDVVKKALDPNHSVIASIGSTTPQQSIENEVDRRVQQIEEDAAETKRLFTDPNDPHGYQRKEILDRLNHMVNTMSQDTGWWRSIDVGAMEGYARLMRSVAGIVRYTPNAPGLSEGARDLLMTRALLAEKAVQTLREHVPLSKKEEAAAYVTSTVSDLAQMGLLSEAFGPIAGEIGGVGSIAQRVLPNVAGFGTYSAAQAAGRNAPLSTVIGEAVKGGALGAVQVGAGAMFHPAEEAATSLGRLGQRAVTTTKQLGPIALGTGAVELASGATPMQAAQSAVTQAAFHVAGAGQELLQHGLFDAKTPTRPRPTVPEDLQAKLPPPTAEEQQSWAAQEIRSRIAAANQPQAQRIARVAAELGQLNDADLLKEAANPPNANRRRAVEAELTRRGYVNNLITGKPTKVRGRQVREPGGPVNPAFADVSDLDLIRRYNTFPWRSRMSARNPEVADLVAELEERGYNRAWPFGQMRAGEAATAPEFPDLATAPDHTLLTEFNALPRKERAESHDPRTTALAGELGRRGYAPMGAGMEHFPGATEAELNRRIGVTTGLEDSNDQALLNEFNGSDRSARKRPNARLQTVATELAKRGYQQSRFSGKFVQEEATPAEVAAAATPQQPGPATIPVPGQEAAATAPVPTAEPRSAAVIKRAITRVVTDMGKTDQPHIREEYERQIKVLQAELGQRIAIGNKRGTKKDGTFKGLPEGIKKTKDGNFEVIHQATGATTVVQTFKEAQEFRRQGPHGRPVPDAATLETAAQIAGAKDGIHPVGTSGGWMGLYRVAGQPRIKMFRDRQGAEAWKALQMPHLKGVDYEGQGVQSGKGGKSGKGEGGFINIGEIADAIQQLRDQFPFKEDSELRAILERTRPYLMQPGISREKEAELMERDRQAVQREQEASQGPAHTYMQLVGNLRADHPDWSPEQLHRWMADNHPELTAKTTGDMGVQELPGADVPEPPPAEAAPTPPAPASAKDRLAAYVAEIKAVRREFGISAKEAARYVLETKPELVYRAGGIADLTGRNVDAGQRGGETITERALRRVRAVEPDLKRQELLRKHDQLITLGPDENYGSPLHATLLAQLRKPQGVPGPPTPPELASQSDVQLTQTYHNLLDTNRIGAADIAGRELRRRGIHWDDLHDQAETARLSPAQRRQQEQRIVDRRAIKVVRPKGSGETGAVDIGEIRRAIKKVYDRVEESGRTLSYDLQTEDGKAVRFIANIKDHEASVFVGEPRDNPNDIDFQRSVNLGTDTVLALRRYFMEQHPEVERLVFSRIGNKWGTRAGTRVLTFNRLKGEGGHLNVGDIAQAAQDLYDQFGARHGTEPDQAEQIIRGHLRPGSSVSLQGGQDYQGYGVVLEFGRPEHFERYSSALGPSMHEEAAKTQRPLKDITRVFLDAEGFDTREHAQEAYKRLRTALDETGRKAVKIEAAKWDDRNDRWSYGGKVSFSAVPTFTESLRTMSERGLDQARDHWLDNYDAALTAKDNTALNRLEKQFDAIQAEVNRRAQPAEAPATFSQRGPTAAPAELVEQGGKLSARRPTEVQLTPQQQERANAILHSQAYYGERLADPSLLNGAIPVDMGDNFTDLAVPLGGQRVSGSLSNAFETRARAEEMADQLEGEPGFKDVRVVPGSEGYRVIWGRDIPNNSAGAGRQFGYSDEALAEFAQKEAGWRAAEQRLNGETGALDIGEVVKGLKKVKDEAVKGYEDLRFLHYVLPVGDENLHVSMSVDRDRAAVSAVYWGAGEGESAVDWSDRPIFEQRAKIGVPLTLAIRKAILAENPGIKTVEYYRAGSTRNPRGVEGLSIRQRATKVLEGGKGETGAVDITEMLKGLKRVKEEVAHGIKAYAYEVPVGDDTLRIELHAQGEKAVIHSVHWLPRPGEQDVGLSPSYEQKVRPGVPMMLALRKAILADLPEVKEVNYYRGGSTRNQRAVNGLNIRQRVTDALGAKKGETGAVDIGEIMKGLTKVSDDVMEDWAGEERRRLSYKVELGDETLKIRLLVRRDEAFVQEVSWDQGKNQSWEEYLNSPAFDQRVKIGVPAALAIRRAILADVPEVKTVSFDRTGSTRNERRVKGLQIRERVSDALTGKKGETGAVDIGELLDGLRKAYEFKGEKRGVRNVGYVIPVGSEQLQIDLSLQGEHAHVNSVGWGMGANETLDEFSRRDVWEQRLKLGHEAVLAIRNQILSLHPEIKEVSFRRVGSTARPRAVQLQIRQRAEALLGSDSKDETGAVNVGEMLKGLQKVIDYVGDSGNRHLRYETRIGDERLAIQLHIPANSDTAQIDTVHWMHPPGTTMEQVLSGSRSVFDQRIKIGVPAALALRRHILAELPEIKQVDFYRAGSTANKRQVEGLPVRRGEGGYLSLDEIKDSYQELQKTLKRTFGRTTEFRDLPPNPRIPTGSMFPKDIQGDTDALRQMLRFGMDVDKPLQITRGGVQLPGDRRVQLTMAQQGEKALIANIATPQGQRTTPEEFKWALGAWLEKHPEVQEIGGERITGAMKGTARAITAEGSRSVPPLLLHTVDDLRAIAKGEGTVKLYHGAPLPNIESMAAGQPMPYRSAEEMGRAVAKAYDIPYVEFANKTGAGHLIGSYRGDLVHKLSTAPVEIAKRWRDNFPLGEILSELDGYARLYKEAKRRGIPFDDFLEQLPPGSLPKQADALGLSSQFEQLRARGGGLAELQVDARAIPERRRRDAARLVRDLDSGKLTAGEVIGSWNGQYQDIKIAPQNVKSVRSVLRNESGHVDLGALRDAFRAGRTKLEDVISQLTNTDDPARAGHFIAQLGQQIQNDYLGLINHKARRDGLHLANEDVATSYFKGLRQFAQLAKDPTDLGRIKQAEDAYHRGDYQLATTRSEQALAGSHDYLNQLQAGISSAELAHLGVPTTTWTTVLGEVRQRLVATAKYLHDNELGALDLSRTPKNGKPDPQLAHIIEPAVEKLWADASKEVSEKRLDVADLRDYVRQQFGEMIKNNFSEWSGVNKTGALAMAAKELERRGRRISAANRVMAEEIAERRLGTLAGTPAKLPESPVNREGKTLAVRRAEHSANVDTFNRLEALDPQDLFDMAAQAFPQEFSKNPTHAVDLVYKATLLPDAKNMAGRVKDWRTEIVRRLNATERLLDKQQAAWEAQGQPAAPAAPEAAAPTNEPRTPIIPLTNLQRGFTELEARQAPDKEYKQLLGVPTRSRLKKGETWRGRAAIAVEGERQAAIAQAIANRPGVPIPLPKGEKPRALYQTLEKTGRLPGGHPSYQPEMMADWKATADLLIKDHGADHAQEFYDNAQPSGVRSMVGLALGDHYQSEAVRTGSTELMEKAVKLANERVLGATSLGQAIVAFRGYNRYTLAGALDEATALYRKVVGVKPDASLPTAVAVEVTKRAQRVVKARQTVDEMINGEQAPPPPPPPRQIKVIKAKDRGKGELGAVGPFAQDPTVLAARARRKAAGQTYRNMQTPGASAQAREAARIELRDSTRELDQLMNGLQREGRGYWGRSNNLTRSFMVSAFTTAMRNFETQTARSVTERLTDAVEMVLRRGVGLGSDIGLGDIARSSFRLGKRSRLLAEQILVDHPQESRMFTNYAGVDVPGLNTVLSGRAWRYRAASRVLGSAEHVAYLANTFNRIQEFHVRSAEFLAELELYTRQAHNLGLEDYINQHGAHSLPKEQITKAVDKALEVTFAANPKQGTDFGDALNGLIKWGNFMPATISPAAFPRFMFNNLKFLYQYSPLGATDAFRAIKNESPSRAIARSMVGIGMLTAAAAARISMGGDKWYELKVGKSTVDARPFGPFSTYLLFAEAGRRAFAGERPLTLREWTEGLGATTSVGGLSQAAVERIWNYHAQGDWDKAHETAVRALKQEGGEIGAAYLTPIRGVKDVLAQFYESQRVAHDVNGEPLQGPLRESIPFASQGMPEAHQTTTGAPVRQEQPGLKALTGWRVETPKTFLQHEIDRLHFHPEEIRSYTGNNVLDTAATKYMGEMADEESATLAQDPGYQRSSEKLKFAILNATLNRINRLATLKAAEDNPDEYRDYIMRKRVPMWKRQLLEEPANPGP